MKITVQGPCRTVSASPPTVSPSLWTAEAEFLSFERPDNQAFRNLFVSDDPVNTDSLLAPGTFLGRFKIRKVTLTLDRPEKPYKWKIADDSDVPEVTLLLETPPVNWIDVTGSSNSFALPETATCIGGEIPLASFQSDDPKWKDYFLPALEVEPSSLVLNSSGISFMAEAKFAWDKPRAQPARFQLVLPFGTDKAPARVSLDREGLQNQPGAIASFRAKFDRLDAVLHPAPGDTGLGAPTWATLEFSSRDGVPLFFWDRIEAPGQDPEWRLGFEKGELFVQLADQPAGDSNRNVATILAQATFKADENGLKIQINDFDPQREAALTYRWEAISGASPGTQPKPDQITIRDVTASYDAVGLAAVLRAQQGIGFVAGPPDPPLLWGVMPMQDGLAQLPFLNVTAQTYVDAGVSPPAGAHSALLAGAVSFGNETAVPPGEQPWSVTLLNAGSFSGEWLLQGSGDQTMLSSVELRVFEPDLELLGMFWLATEPPTAADALPPLDNWMSGLYRVPLSTATPGDPTPASFQIKFSQIDFHLGPKEKGQMPTLLTKSEFTYFCSGVLAKFRSSDEFKGRDLKEGDIKPLVWRRHPSLPAVQSLPLTQSQRPPNHPSRSRQLAPFELAVSKIGNYEGWSFRSNGRNAAQLWPQAVAAANPAQEWTRLPNLPIAAISLPGLAFDPNAPKTIWTSPGSGFLPPRLQYGLPFLDEIFALADMPKEAAEAGAAAAASALTREQYADYWSDLAEESALARADAEDLIDVQNGKPRIKGLAEPFFWPVSLSLQDDVYPGTVQLKDDSGAAAGNPDPNPLELSRESALEGISRDFQQDPQTGNLILLPESTNIISKFQVVANSMAAQGMNGALRDQRGLVRHASQQQKAGGLIVTPLSVPGSGDIQLCTLPAAISLGMGWQIWFRDIPVKSEEGRLVFQRMLSQAARDVNDPAALSPERVALSGYEWRMGPQRLLLHGLLFDPLTLERVELTGDQVTRIDINGQLLLKWADVLDAKMRGNTVCLTFTGNGPLQLTDVRVVPANEEQVEPAISDLPGDWPLAKPDSNNPYATVSSALGTQPRLLWKGIKFENDRLLLTGAQLNFNHWDTRWQYAFDEPLDLGKTEFSLTLPEAINEQAFVSRVELKLNVDSDGSDTSVDLRMVYRWGDSKQLMVEAEEVLAVYHAGGLLPSNRLQVWLARDRHRFLQLKVDDGPAQGSTTGAFQASWSAICAPQFSAGAEATTGAQDWQLLPGMALSADRPVAGFATVTFEVDKTSVPPRLRSRAGFAELVLHCQWGEFLQEPGSATRQRIYGSSAGDLWCGYTIRFNDGSPGTSSLVLNGFLELKNLITWPKQDPGFGFRQEVEGTPDNPKFHIPDRNAKIDHTRHTTRILLNQHHVPAEALTAGWIIEGVKPAGCFLQLSGKGWHLHSVVEHQLVDLTKQGDGSITVTNDRRWTVPQELRLLTPASLSGILSGFRNQKYVVADASKGETSTSPFFSDRDASYLHERLLHELLSGKPNALDQMTRAIIVEASNVFCVKSQRSSEGLPSFLQSYPGLEVLTVPSTLDDFRSATANPATWTLQVLPFIGRLQESASDATGEGNLPGNVSPLQVDPVLVTELTPQQQPLPSIVRLLASREEKTARDIPVSPFDRSERRNSSGLDLASLDESWFRLQNANAHPDQDSGIGSILLSAPINPLARLSVEATLIHLLDPYRESLPPAPEQSGSRDTTAGLVPRLTWGRERLFTLTGVIPREAGDYSLYLAGTAIFSSGLTGETAPAHYPAVTIFPALMDIEGRPNPQPVSLAVSPYVKFSRKTVPAPVVPPDLIFAELLVLDPHSGKLTNIASQMWEKENAAVAKAQDRMRWALETRQRLAPESPSAVMRLRQVYRAEQHESRPVDYSFVLLEFQGVRNLVAPVSRVRAPLPHVRFSEGQFDAQTAPPDPLSDFEAAPPQVRGVQPIYKTARPTPDGGGNVHWPWGVSALRFHVQAATEGIPAPALQATRFWWHAVSQSVQFSQDIANAQSTNYPALPKLFRAPAIDAMLPAPPGTCLPDLQGEQWQSILPDQWDVFVSGGRPGVPFVFRHQLIRKNAGQPPVASGAVPVQHRMLRPLPIPRNTNVDLALQTWASFFEPEQSLHTSRLPYDNFFQAAGTSGPNNNNVVPAIGLQFTIVGPGGAVIPSDWDGKLVLHVAGGDGAPMLRTDWDILVELQDETGRLALTEMNGDGHFLWTWNIPDSAAASSRALLADKKHGDLLRVVVGVARVGAEAIVTGYRQRLVFPVWVKRPAILPSPLCPVMVQFEDPEYNRSLVSETKRVEGVWVDNGVRRPVILASDRREYNSNSRVYLVLSAPSAQPIPIVVNAISKDGVRRKLADSQSTDAKMQPPEIHPLEVYEYDIAQYGAVAPGESLEFLVNMNPRAVALSADIVSASVIPSVESAFALLRKQDAVVECVRFAWSPAAARIELINPADLIQRETVRRRAVYQWIDTVRAGIPCCYAIQKISTSGATHFLTPREWVSPIY